MSEGVMYVPRGHGAGRQSMSGGQAMGWAFLLFMLFWPRLFMIGFWIFSRDLGNAFSSWVIPALGFLVAPATTVLYAFMWSISSNEVSGWEWAGVALGVLIDLATWALAARLAARSR